MHGRKRNRIVRLAGQGYRWREIAEKTDERYGVVKTLLRASGLGGRKLRANERRKTDRQNSLASVAVITRLLSRNSKPR